MSPQQNPSITAKTKNVSSASFCRASQSLSNRMINDVKSVYAADTCARSARARLYSRVSCRDDGRECVMITCVSVYVYVSACSIVRKCSRHGITQTPEHKSTGCCAPIAQIIWISQQTDTARPTKTNPHGHGARSFGSVGLVQSARAQCYSGLCLFVSRLSVVGNLSNKLFSIYSIHSNHKKTRPKKYRYKKYVCM